MANIKPLKKVKKKTVSKLKKELDKVFSEWIRRSYANIDGMVSCYTCGRLMHWKEIQNGHFLSRQYLATRYSEDNCRPQCVGDNVFGNGKVAIFGDKLESELGIGTVARLHREARQIVKNYPYESQIEYYKNKLNEL